MPARKSDPARRLLRFAEEIEVTVSFTMPLPIDQRKKPTAVKIHVKTGAGVDVTWADGHESHFDFPLLRDHCPCATCNDERGKKEVAISFVSMPAASAVLPMYKPKARAQSATQVGNYAIQLSFNDGHSTGIYSYDFLRTICPCEDCSKEFRATPESKSTSK